MLGTAALVAASLVLGTGRAAPSSSSSAEVIEIRAPRNGSTVTDPVYFELHLDASSLEPAALRALQVAPGDWRVCYAIDAGAATCDPVPESNGPGNVALERGRWHTVDLWLDVDEGDDEPGRQRRSTSSSSASSFGRPEAAQWASTSRFFVDGSSYLAGMRGRELRMGTARCVDDADAAFYASRVDRVKRSCGATCRIVVEEEEEEDAPMTTEEVLLSGVTKAVDCDALWDLEDVTNASSAVGHVWPPPKRPPCAMLDAYLSDGTATLASLYFDKDDSLPESTWSAALVETMVAAAKRRDLAGGYGPDYTRLVQRGVDELNVTGLKVLVIGSTSPWLEALLLAAGAAHVTTLEYRPIDTDSHPRLTAVLPVELRATYKQHPRKLFDAIVTISSLEHSGLGRYRDALDPFGDLIALARASCLAKPSAKLLLGLPYDGHDSVAWNAHRIYGPRRYRNLVANWDLLWEVPLVGNEAVDWQRIRLFQNRPLPPASSPPSQCAEASSTHPDAVHDRLNALEARLDSLVDTVDDLARRLDLVAKYLSG